MIPRAPLTDSRRGSPEGEISDCFGAGDSRHVISGGIGRGLRGGGASGVGPAVEDRQPEPLASVVGCGQGWNGSGGRGEDRRHGSADTARVAKGAHAVVLLDRAGWHITSKLNTPENITPIFPPSRAPELNPVENLWQYLRQNWISNTVFENYDAITDAACDAWRS